MPKLGQRSLTKGCRFTQKTVAIISTFPIPGLLCLLVAVVIIFSSATPSWQLSPAHAQRFDPNTVWQQVYEQLPDLPLENQYLSRETGETVPENTLISRLIRYHIYVQGRPTIYRLDWKLTLADYLGVNEFIEPLTYPSSDTLTSNPIEGDVAAIKSLNLAQRDALVQTIVDLFNSAYSSPASTTDQQEPVPSSLPSSELDSPRSEDSVDNPSPPLRAPQPGDAELLLP